MTASGSKSERACNSFGTLRDRAWEIIQPIIRLPRDGQYLRSERGPIIMRLVAEKRAAKSTRLNSSHLGISYAVFCLKKKNEGDGKLCSSPRVSRSEEHTSELQSLRHLVCRLLLE